MTIILHHASLETGLEASAPTEKLDSQRTQEIHFYHISRYPLRTSLLTRESQKLIPP